MIHIQGKNDINFDNSKNFDDNSTSVLIILNFELDDNE